MYAHTVATAVGDANWRILDSTFGASSTVEATFTNVIKVLEDSILEFKEYSIKIWIRRRPETHIAAVLPVALELQSELAEADSAVS